ncbi:MAG: SURF1 family protein [Bowdeniella nasicola]|nr:SURF1 family protein [Bowdeniella nasicola]
MASPVTAREWLRSALSPRMLAVFVLFAIAAGVCVQLGSWQLARSLERGEAGARAREAEMRAADPRPLSEVLSPQTEFRSEHLGAKVEVSGTYGGQVVVPGRLIDGQDATLIVTELHVTSGPDAGAHLAVLRGWVPASEVGLEGERLFGAENPAISPPPGEHELIGYLANSEQEASLSHIEGALTHLSTSQLANVWGTPTYTGYLVLADQQPPGGLERLAPPPNLVKDSGRNWQNLGYAIEWFIFGGFAFALWAKMVRDEALHSRPRSAPPGHRTDTTSLADEEAP